jgi:hypothetical protein
MWYDMVPYTPHSHVHSDIHNLHGIHHVNTNDLCITPRKQADVYDSIGSRLIEKGEVWHKKRNHETAQNCIQNNQSKDKTRVRIPAKSTVGYWAEAGIQKQSKRKEKQNEMCSINMRQTNYHHMAMQNHAFYILFTYSVHQAGVQINTMYEDSTPQPKEYRRVGLPMSLERYHVLPR